MSPGARSARYREIAAVVERHGGNQAKAARELGVANSTVSVAVMRARCEIDVERMAAAIHKTGIANCRAECPEPPEFGTFSGADHDYALMLSDGERAFLFQVRALELPMPLSEVRFHPLRRWRFDFAWPDLMLAVEIEGGSYAAGRHSRGLGFEGDAEKYNAAVAMGWRVLRFTTRMVTDGRAIETLRKVLRVRHPPCQLRPARPGMARLALHRRQRQPVPRRSLAARAGPAESRGIRVADEWAAVVRPVSPRRVRKRFTFSFEGASCVLLAYTDGTASVRVDHPSNAPAIEGMIAGRLAQMIEAALAAEGFDTRFGPIRWRGDPDGTPPMWTRPGRP